MMPWNSVMCRLETGVKASRSASGIALIFSRTASTTACDGEPPTR
ncbi:hypothetical protein X742_04095 [Mesorhizobium sp. LNHC232B00]|nr:hypothetical protein X742_04095 [Mesorhizobium sp. LNHC232B00]